MGVFKAEKEGLGGLYRIVNDQGGVEGTIRPLHSDSDLVAGLADNIAAALSGRKMRKLPFNGLSIHYQQGPETVIRLRAGLGNSIPACAVQTREGPLPDRLVFDVLNKVELTDPDRDVARRRGGPRRPNGPSSPR